MVLVDAMLVGLVITVPVVRLPALLVLEASTKVQTVRVAVILVARATTAPVLLHLALGVLLGNIKDLQGRCHAALVRQVTSAQDLPRLVPRVRLASIKGPIVLGRVTLVVLVITGVSLQRLSTATYF